MYWLSVMKCLINYLIVKLLSSMSHYLYWSKSVWECAITDYNHLSNSLNKRLRCTPKSQGSINYFTNRVASYASTLSKLCCDTHVQNVSVNLMFVEYLPVLCFHFILSFYFLSLYHIIVLPFHVFIYIMYAVHTNKNNKQFQFNILKLQLLESVTCSLLRSV